MVGAPLEGGNKLTSSLIFCPTLAEAFSHADLVFPNQEIEPGKLARFSTNDLPGDTAGWCKLFFDGVGAVFGCHREGTSFTWQRRDSNIPPPSQVERQAAQARSEEANQQAAVELVAQYAEAAANGVKILGGTSELDPEHAYVRRKAITPYCARQNSDGSIVLSLHGPDETLQSLQFIGVPGSKRFLYKAKVKGGRLILGTPENGRPLVLCEGWATGCSLHEATGETVVIGFSGSNLDDVAADLRRQFPDSSLKVAGDLDVHSKGFEYAQAAAAAGAPAVVVLPVFKDGRDRGDFNDMHQSEGLEAVRLRLYVKPATLSREIDPFMEPSLPKCDARDGTLNTRPLSEYGNAQRLFDAKGDHLKYVYDAQIWLIWDGESWQVDTGSAVRSLAAKLPRSIYAEGDGHLAEAERFARWARKSQEQRTTNAAVSMLSDFASIRLQRLYIDANHFVVGFDQGRQVINLRNGSTRAAIPGDYVTKSLVPATMGNSAKAVRWIQFLDQVFNGDHELIGWMQRFCGYLLTGSTQEQIFLFCFGHGANGKSVFIDILKHIMGDYSRAIASETLSESKRQAGGATPDLAALIGARLVISSETEDNTALAESLVKGLVGGDTMSVRQLYAAPVQFTPHFKLVMAGNHKPIVRGNDNGIWRRVRLVPFNRTFSPTERDSHLLDKLRAEGPHILAWMVAGCIEWQRLGLANTPAAIRQATDAYQVDQDLIGSWLGECTVNTSSDETSSSDLYANYKAWSLDNGLRPASAILLGRRLSDRGYTVRQSHGKRLWCGLIMTDLRHADATAYSRKKDGY